MDVPLWARVEKTTIGIEKHGFFVKEKIPGSVVSKKFMMNVLPMISL